MNKLFRILESNEPKPSKYAAFGFELGTLTDFASYISGYKEAIKRIYDYFEATPDYSIDVHDTLVFPLCFLYRHVTELYIKYVHLYFAKTKDDYSRFLSNTGHLLLKAWNQTEPLLEELLQRFPSRRNMLSYFRECVTEIDNFDGSSMRMRYPISKKFIAMNPEPISLDVCHLHSGMVRLFDCFDDLIFFVDKVFIDNKVSEAFEVRFSAEYHNALPALESIIAILQRYSSTDDHTPVELRNLSDIPAIETEYERRMAEYIKAMDLNQLVTILLLLYTGRDLCEHRFLISEVRDDRRKDLLLGLEITQRTINELRFDPNETDRWVISEKLLNCNAKLIYRWLSEICSKCEVLL